MVLLYEQKSWYLNNIFNLAFSNIRRHMKPFQSNLFTILYGNITVHCVTVIPTK